MTAADLTKYGLAQVARVRIEDRKFIIDITDSNTVDLEECIYAFLIGGKVVRIGSSKAPLKDRLKSYERHITHALNGKKSPAPEKEAKKWSELLPPGASGDIYARQATTVTTPLGEIRVYMDEESILIGKLFSEEPHDHILNRCKYR
jgi:hypothetical protein